MTRPNHTNGDTNMSNDNINADVSHVARTSKSRIAYSAPNPWQHGERARLIAVERDGVLFCELTGEKLDAATTAAIFAQVAS
jgi:hypothetical protein